MLYISDRRAFEYFVICDSCTGATFKINSDDAGYRYDGRYYSIRDTLGYITTDVIRPVPKELVDLLGYIDSIEYYKIGESGMYICSDTLLHIDKYNILVMTDRYKVCNVLDMLMCASYGEGFQRWLELGYLVVNFCEIHRFKITFCGAYKPYISKLVTLYRGIWENQGKLVSDSIRMLG